MNTKHKIGLEHGDGTDSTPLNALGNKPSYTKSADE